jgi:hypothetical protein
MEETLLKLRILASAEMNLARVKSRRYASRAIFFAVAAGLFLLAVIMVNIGAYQWLSERYSPSDAAFVVATGNAVLGLLLGIIGWRVKAGPEEQMAREIREMALEELTADVDELQSEVSRVGKDVKRIRSGFSILTKGGQIGAGLASLAPVIKTVVDAVTEHRKEKKAKAENA